MEKYRLCCVYLGLVQICNGVMQIDEASEDNEIHKCIITIIQRIEVFGVTDVTLINVNESLAKNLHFLSEHRVRFISRSFYWPNDTLFNDVYIIQCENYFMFEEGLDLVKRDPFWNPRAKFVIIVEFVEDFLQDVSDFLMHNHIYDVAVVVYDEDQDVVVYTFGLEYDECDRPVFKILHLLSRCSAIHNIDKIYADARKPTLSGCHVKFVSHEYWPFVSFHEKDAIEQYLLKLIYQYENITVDVIDFGKIENFGSRLPNFTYTGMLHEIEIYNVEGAIGGYVLTLNRMSNLDFVYPFLVDHQKIVLARAKLLGKWNGVLYQLGVLSVWAVFATFVFTCGTVILMRIFREHLKDTSRDILIVWGYFLGNISQSVKSKSGLPYRLVLLSVLVFVFIVSCATQASLLSVTTHPIRSDQPNLVDEVVSNYQLLVSPSQYAYLKSNYAINVTNALTSCRMTLDCIIKVMNHPNERLFTIASDIYHQSNIWEFADENGELKVHKIKESAGTLLQTMYIRRGSSLVQRFNRLLLRIQAGGFVNKFVEGLHFKGRLKYKFHGIKERKPDSLRGLRGVFIVLVCGYVLSLATFLFEYVLYRLHKMAI